MKFLIDNNLPVPLARALDELSKPDKHQVFALRERFAPNTPDIEWIGTLGQESDWAVVSQDRFRKGDLEKRAFQESGVLIFCLARQWSQATYWDKAHALVRWWPKIINQAEMITGGGAFKVPYRLSGRFEQIRL